MSLALRHEALQEATDIVSQEVASFDGLTEEILTRVAIETVKKYQQKLNVGIQDSATDLLDAFKQKITEHIFDTANSWKLIVRDPFIFPKNCRFCYQKGETIIIVIEQDPQVRSLVFESRALGNRDADPITYVGETQRISLALPYVIFFLHFKSGIFYGLYSGWRNRPISSLEDFVGRPVLPNVHDHLNVCTGRNSSLPEGTIVEQSDYVISRFWNSRFNNDLSDYWWRKESLDSRFSTDTWAETSEEDPLFVLNINYGSFKSVQQVIDLLSMHETAMDEGPLRHRLSEEIDKCVEFLFYKILRYFKKTKFERHHPKDVEEHLKNAIKQSSGQFVETVNTLSQEIQRLSQDVHLSQNKLTEDRGVYWREYCP